MIKIISIFISSVILMTNAIYIWCKVSNNKIDFKRFRFYIIFLISLFLLILNYYFINNTLKVVNITIILIFIYKLLFKNSLKDSIIIPTIVELLYVLCESVFVMIILLFVNNDINKFMDTYFNSIFSNLAISLMVLFVSQNKLFCRIITKINNKVSAIEESVILFMLLLCIMLYSILTVRIYYMISPYIMITMSVIITIISLLLVYLFFKAKVDYYKINNKYDNSLISLRELEELINNYRIDNHENKNQLLTIKSMTKNKKVISFIDSILESKLKDNSKIISETSIIPSGGLRGLIYSKILLMDSKNIEYELEVEKSIRITNLLNYGNDTMLDICKIVGIFLDNAIEELENYDDKYIIIEMYKKDKSIVISITNPINHSINENIYKVGYSTKGNNHGYGLSLVNKVVKNNGKLKTYSEISDIEFTQVLEISK